MLTDFERVLRWIVSEGGSLNMYMFHGGTNFGFTAGANDRLSATNESYIMEYSPVVTSYGTTGSVLSMTTDRQHFDGRTTTYSEREREFTFAIR